MKKSEKELVRRGFRPLPFDFFVHAVDSGLELEEAASFMERRAEDELLALQAQKNAEILAGIQGIAGDDAKNFSFEDALKTIKNIYLAEAHCPINRH